jgi:nitronate monooxygenase
MWPSRRFSERVGIAHPIVQAPMAGSCTPALAAAVCEGGGLGSLGVGPRSPDLVRERVGRLRAATDRPFNLNFFAHRAPAADAGRRDAARAALAADYAALGLGDPPEPPADGAAGFGEERLELLLDLAPAVATFHFGLPPRPAIERLSAAGIVVGATATSTAEARAVAGAGCDFVVAQGFEAGGHRGAHVETAADGGVGLLALVPQVVDAVSIPVVAAGGIADARGIAAAFALGADGVQMGSAFLLCPEAETDAPRRARIAAAADTDTAVTLAISGRANRVSASPFVCRMAGAGTPHLPFPLHYALSGPLAEAGGEDYAAHQYGQAAALARALPAAELMARLVRESRARLAWLGGAGAS